MVLQLACLTFFRLFYILFGLRVKQCLVKQRLEFSTFLHFNLVKVYACNSVSSENNVPANTMCT